MPEALEVFLQCFRLTDGSIGAAYQIAQAVRVRRAPPEALEPARTGSSTLEEVFTTFNRDDRHGGTSHLSNEELNALIRFLNYLPVTPKG